MKIGPKPLCFRILAHVMVMRLRPRHAWTPATRSPPPTGKLPSLKAYLIVEGEEMRVERHWRDETDQWRQAKVTRPEGVVPFSCPETELALAQIYEGL